MRASDKRPSTYVVIFVAVLLIVSPQKSWAAGGSVVITQGITATYPDGWSVAPAFFMNAQKLVNVPADQQASLSLDSTVARVMITTEQRTSHAEAVNRLQQISTETVGGEQGTPSCVAVCGWPAVQRRYLIPRPQHAENGADENGETQLLRITTAVAVDALVVRLEGSLDPDAPAATVDQIISIGTSLQNCPSANAPQTQSDIQTVCPPPPITRNNSAPGSVLASTRPHSDVTRLNSVFASAKDLLARWLPAVQNLLTPASAYAATAQQLGLPSELEVAVSSDGKDIVVCGQGSYATSNDGGVTFPFFGGFPNVSGGDSTLGFGKSGNFYAATLALNVNSVAFDISSDNGRTFTFRANPFVCPTMGANACSPDQEHIVADRVNAASGGDQAYVVWRNFDAMDQDPGIVCSQDGGTNWTTPVTVGSGFVPRINIGQDGFVYVVYRTVGMTGGDIMLNKYSSCASGLVQQSSFPLKVTSVTDVPCPVAGLDRCNLGANILSSHMVAVDDTNANHVYVSYTSHSAAGNDDVFVIDSTDGGKSWGSPVRINGAVTGTRFMPWVCSVRSAARVSWYDRRAAVGGSTNDLADYFCGSASGSGASLVAGSELKLTSSPDAQCAAGKTPGSAQSWPCRSRGTGGAESCSIQPQLAGRCGLPSPPPTPTPNPSTNTPCDFSDCGVCEGGKCVGTANACTTDADCTRSGACTCGSTENCQGGGGCPKYGDYNGNACGAGRIYTAWASATAPMGLPAPGGITLYVESKLADGIGPDLAITKVDANAPNAVSAGTDLTYNIHVVNNSTVVPALNAAVNDTLPANTTFVSLVNPFTWLCSTPLVGDPGTVSCKKNFVATGETADFTLVVHVSPSAPNASTISNTATVASQDPDAHPADNTSTAMTTVITRADLSVLKIDEPQPVIPGTDVNTTVTVANSGPSDAQNVVVQEAVPLNTTFSGIFPPFGWTCTAPPVGGTGTISCTIPTLPAGDSAQIIILVKVGIPVPSGTMISNTVTVSSTTTDPSPDNNVISMFVFAIVPVPLLGRLGLAMSVLLLLAVAARFLLLESRVPPVGAPALDRERDSNGRDRLG